MQPDPTPAAPTTQAGHCYDDDEWREKQLSLNAGRGTWGGNDGSVRGVLEAWELPLEGFLRSLCDWGYEIVEAEARDTARREAECCYLLRSRIRTVLETVLLGRRFGNGLSTDVIDEVMSRLPSEEER